MYFLRPLHGPQSVLYAVFAKRVLCDIPVTDMPPVLPISFRTVIWSFVLLILRVHLFCVFCAVRVLRKFRTARIPARLLRSSRHTSHSLSQKVATYGNFYFAPQNLTPVSTFLTYDLSDFQKMISVLSFPLCYILSDMFWSDALLHILAYQTNSQHNISCATAEYLLRP